MKTKTLIILISSLILLMIFVPFGINESYKAENGYVTVWSGDDLLIYFGSILSALGTIIIGLVAFKQNEKTNEINDRLLKIQEINSTPYLHIDAVGSKIQSFDLMDIDILLGLRNESNGVINIVEVSDLKINALFKENFTIPFCKGWTTHYSVLPHQTKELNFTVEVKNNELITKVMKHPFLHEIYQLVTTLELKLQYVNSNEIFLQKIEFYLHIYRLEDKQKFNLVIINVENDLEKVK